VGPNGGRAELEAEAMTTTGTFDNPAAPSVPHLIQMRKRGRLTTLAKIVEVAGEPVLAQVYRDPARPAPEVVSQPPAVLHHAVRCSARRWLVRLDSTGACFAIALDEAIAAAWRHPSDGRLELFVPLSRFQRVAWVDWAYIPPDGPAVVLDDEPARAGARLPRQGRGEGRQLPLFNLGAEEGAV
jgi:hypothetical protein